MTDVEVVRFLIDDTGSPPNFTDDQIQAMLDLNSGSVYYAAATAMDALAVRAEATTATSVTIGSYSRSQKGGVLDYQGMADRFRLLEVTTPSFEVAEEAFTNVGQWELIRNYVLRNGA